MGKMTGQVYCLICLSLFTAADARSRICSPGCNAIRAAKGKGITPHPCRHCQKIFRPRTNAHVTFCSRECAYTYRTLNRQVKPRHTERRKLCSACHCEFMLGRTCLKIYCSAKCSQFANLRRKFPSIDFNCKECGKVCSKNQRPGARVFCSRRCTIRFSRRTRHDNKRIRQLITDRKGIKLRELPRDLVETARLIRELNKQIWRKYVRPNIHREQVSR